MAEKEFLNRNISAEIFGGEIQYFRLEPRYWDDILWKLKDSH